MLCKEGMAMKRSYSVMLLVAVILILIASFFVGVRIGFSWGRDADAEMLSGSLARDFDKYIKLHQENQGLVLEKLFQGQSSHFHSRVEVLRAEKQWIPSWVLREEDAAILRPQHDAVRVQANGDTPRTDAPPPPSK